MFSFLGRVQTELVALWSLVRLCSIRTLPFTLLEHPPAQIRPFAEGKGIKGKTYAQLARCAIYPQIFLCSRPRASHFFTPQLTPLNPPQIEHRTLTSKYQTPSNATVRGPRGGCGGDRQRQGGV